MLTSPQIFLSLLFLATLFYWLVPNVYTRTRASVLILFSGFFVLAVAPGAFAFVCYLSFIATLGSYIVARKKSSLVLLLCLALTMFPLLYFRLVYTRPNLIYTLGIAFGTLRALNVIIETYQRKIQLQPLNVLLHAFFLPLYSAGPVESTSLFRIENLNIRFSLDHFAYGLPRIALGFFKCGVISGAWIPGMLSSLGFNPQSATQWESIQFILFKFFYTYINFSGYSDIAIGTSRLFGLKVMENFNFPFLSMNVQDFWRRWHMSLGGWVIRNLFFPIVAAVRNRYAILIASTTTFVILGFWHEASINYLLWGVLHGVALAWVQWSRKNFSKNRLYQHLSRNYLYMTLSCALTVLYVAWLQTLANEQNFENAIQLTMRLAGL